MICGPFFTAVEGKFYRRPSFLPATGLKSRVAYGDNMGRATRKTSVEFQLNSLSWR
jgi:hypothetical protein